MKVAICGYPPWASQIISILGKLGIECTHFISDLVSSHGEQEIKTPSGLQPTNFFEFRRLIDADELEGIVIVDTYSSYFIYDAVKLCKLYNIPNVIAIDQSFFQGIKEIRYLDSDKAFLPQLEANLIDSCNLNCKACAHYSNLFDDSCIYQLDDYARDLRQIARNADILNFYVLGGEPLKLKNLDKYLNITKKFLPNTNLILITNGLLVPSLSQNILDTLRETGFKVEVSMYPPTVKICDKIQAIFKENNIPYQLREEIYSFNAFLTLHGGHNPEKARAACKNNVCRFLHNGKIYKCPPDALSFRFTEYFGIKNFPAATGVDIFAKNFSALMAQLDGNIELCYWCNETARPIKWTPENNPKLTDWLADPAELEYLFQK